MSDNVQVIGTEELARALKAKGVAIEKQMVKAVTATIFDIQKRAKRKAPVDTGFLRARIVAGVEGDGLAGIVASGDVWVDIQRMKLIGPPESHSRDSEADNPVDVDYAAAVHNGHRTRGGSTVAGNPYLAKAAQESERQMASRTASLIKGVL